MAIITSLTQGGRSCNTIKSVVKTVRTGFRQSLAAYFLDLEDLGCGKTMGRAFSGLSSVVKPLTSGKYLSQISKIASFTCIFWENVL